MRTLCGLCACVAVLMSAGAASALDIPLHDLRIGIRGGPNINIITEVSEDDPDPVYPGFVGIGWFIGGALSYDFMDIVGLTIEVLYSSERASGSAEFSDDVGPPGSSDLKKEQSDFTLEASAVHLPIYVRGQIPGGVARPFLHVGVDLVLSRSSHAMSVERRGDAPPFTPGCTPGVDCDPFPPQNYEVNGIDSQTFFLLGVGIDIDVGPVTIPIEFRGLFNFGHGDSIRDRTRSLGQGEAGERYAYNNDLTYQVMVLFGVNYVIF
jgi:hypothetical protein